MDSFNRSKGFQAFNTCLDLITENERDITILDKDIVEHILDLSMDFGEYPLAIRTFFSLVQINPENIEYTIDFSSYFSSVTSTKKQKYYSEKVSEKTRKTSRFYTY